MIEVCLQFPLQEMRNPLKKNGVLSSYTVEEIKEVVRKFGDSAEGSINRVGFDFVEIHGAHGYIIDQFLQAATNKRNDQKWRIH